MSIDTTSSQRQDDETPATGDKSAERTTGTPVGPNDDRGRQRAEMLTREEYADAKRADGPPIREDSPHSLRSANGSGTDSRADTEKADRGGSGPYDRERDGNHAGMLESEPDRAAPTRAEPLTREEYADAVRGNGPLDDHQERAADPDTEPARDASAGAAVTHFHSEFKGQQYDLYTDGTRWAVADPEQDVVTVDADRAEPGSRQETADEVAADSGVVYVDGREVQATHDPTDGIWFEGMGEIPDAPIGDPYGTGRAGEVVASPEDVKMSRLERLNRVVCERLDDIVDEIDHNAETVQELHDKDPPGSSAPIYTGTTDRSPQISPSIPDHGVEFGHGLDAVLVMGAVGAKLGNWVNEKWQQRVRDRNHGSD